MPQPGSWLSRIRASRARSLLCPALLVLGILLPYYRLVTLQGLIITDDKFISDVANGEFPARVVVGQQIRDGEIPGWAVDGCGGGPALGAGGAADPFSVLFFAFLPPVAALNCFILAVLLVAALGTYAYCRTIGASQRGSLLAGLAFAYSGYMVCQLKHLGIVATLCWFPIGLWLLELALRRGSGPADERKAEGARAPSVVTRWLLLLAFAAVFGVQVLAAFPQTAYISGLVYGAYALVRAWPLRDPGTPSVWGRYRVPVLVLLAFASACLVAAGLGAVELVPQWKLGSYSRRAGGGTLDWATFFAYWPRNALTFFVPYINGDVGDGTYKGHSIFWEDYGYVGLATVLLAIFAGARFWRGAHLAFWTATVVLAYLLVLGRATPLYGLAFKYLPGLSLFRFPTRFLFVVDFGLAVLAALGLSRMEAWLAERRRGARAAGWIGAALVAITLFDLVYHQMRQNPIADADRWMAPPQSVRTIQQDQSLYRIYTLFHYELHGLAHVRAHGWSDLEPYYQLREYVQPNLNQLWGLQTGDCYCGIMGRWTEDVWGSHNRGGLVSQFIKEIDGRIHVEPSLFRLLGLFNVRYVLSPVDLSKASALERVSSPSPVQIYRVRSALPRAYVVSGAVWRSDPDQAAEYVLSRSFNPRREVVLHGAPPGRQGQEGGVAPAEWPGAEVARYTASEVEVRTSSSRGGFLVLSDSWYPGWEAEVDGQPRPILRANLNQRAVEVPAGRHTVRFVFRSGAIQLGLAVSGASLALLLLGVLVLRRAARRPSADAVEGQEVH